MRLICNQAISNTIMYYDHLLHVVESASQREDVYTENCESMMEELFNSKVFDQMEIPSTFEFKMAEGNPQLLTEDKRILQKFINHIHFLKSINYWHLRWYTKQIKVAYDILDYFQKKYDLQ